MALPARPLSVLRHQHLGAGRAQEALQAPARQPVGGEDAVLERGQRVEVAALGVANADRGVRRMGKGGGHRHRQGRPIDTSFDSSFAAPAHRPQGFEPVCRRPRPTEERGRRPQRSAATEQGKVPLCCNDAASSRRDPHRCNQVSPQPRPNRFRGLTSCPPKPYRCNQGTPPRPEKNPVAIGASAPIHPRVGQSGPPGFHPGGLAFARRQEGRMTRRHGAMAWRQGRRADASAAVATAAGDG